LSASSSSCASSHRDIDDLASGLSCPPNNSQIPCKLPLNSLKFLDTRPPEETPLPPLVLPLTDPPHIQGIAVPPPAPPPSGSTVDISPEAIASMPLKLGIETPPKKFIFKQKLAKTLSNIWVHLSMYPYNNEYNTFNT
jgi:hypothetical protein